MRSKRVLIAEDNRDGADSLGHLVKAWGHQAEVVYDGHSAVSLAATFRPDVVIMDINMPIMDGYKAARLLRDAHEQVLLIAMTGAPMVETRHLAREAGFHHHFSKPVELDDLRRLLDSDTLDHLVPGFRMCA